MIHENPLFPGTPLNGEQECATTHLSWIGVPLAVRQIVRLAVEFGEINPQSPGAVERLGKMLDDIGDSMEGLFRRRFNNAAIILQEHLQTGHAPSMVLPEENAKDESP